VLLRNLSNASTQAAQLEQAKSEFNDLLTLASQAPFRLESLTNAFVKMRAAGIEPANETLQSLVDALAAAGGTDDQLNRAAIAIQQMAGKGVISMEELRQQLGEAVPRAIQLMARSMNLTMAELVDRISRGQVEAGNALQSLTAEFNRTFGGTALLQMDTFQGRLAQLRTAWTRFALVVGGEPGSGGFFDAVKNALQALTEGLGSSEAQAFGIRLNTVMRDLTNGVVASVQALLDWRGVIETTARALLVLFVAVRGYTILVGMAAALAAVRLQLASLPAALAAATVSLTAFRNAAAGAAGASAAMSLTTYLGSLVSGFGNLAAAAGGAFLRLGALSRVLVAFTGFGAIIAGVTLFGEALRFLGITSDRTANSLARLREGQADSETLRLAQERIELLNRDLPRLRQLQAEVAEAAARAQRGASFSLRAPGQTAMGRGVEALEGRQVEMRSGAFAAGSGEAARALAEVNRVILENERELGELITQLRGAQEERRNRESQVYANRRVLIAQGEFRQINQTYDTEQKELEERLRTLAGDAARQGSAERQGVEAELRASRERRYASQITGLERLITAEDQILQAAQQRRDAQAEANSRATIERFQEEVEKLRRAREAGNLDGRVTLLASDENTIQRAERRILQMRARIEELRAEVEQSNPELAKMDVLLASFASAGVPESLLARLRETAEELGNIERSARDARRVLTLGRQIDTGYERARADLERYTQALTNPDIPEAQRSFVTFQTQMLGVLDELGTKLDTNGEKYQALAAKIRLAIETARQSSVVQSEVELEREAERARLRTAERGSQRFEIEKKQIEDRIDLLLAQRRAENLLNNRPEEEGLARIRANGDALIAAAQTQVDRVNAGAGRRAEGTIAGLRGRVAELQEQVRGAGGEWAKWNATLGANASTAAGRQILGLAREVEQLEDRLERLNNAYGTLERLRRQSMEGRESLDIANQVGDEAGGVLRPYLEAQAQGQRALEQIKRDRQLNQQETEAAERQLAERLAGIGQGVLATQQQNWADQTRTLRQGLATSRAERRTEGLDSIAIEERRAQRLIELANLTTEQRATAEERLQAYLTARRAQVDRDTESALQKQIREYSNLADNLEGAFASAFEGMNDALTEFVMTGKLSFKDLADSIIRDIVRIALRAATSQVLGMLIGSVGGASFNAGQGNTIPTVGGPGFTGGNFHTGGIVGKGGSPVTLPAAVWSGAPRLHKGGWLKDDEMPAILQRGEAVFTADQLAELGRLNRSYTFVEGMMGRLVSAATSVPVSAMPAMPSVGASGMGGSVPPVTVNIVNQSGQPLEGVAGAPRMDVEGMIIDVVVNNMQRPGRMRDAVRGVV
jgi:lambda family phage tail tape measure protein